MRRETEFLKPIDKAIFGMAASHRAVVKRTRMWPRNATDKFEMTPLEYASMFNHPGVAKVLINHGADVDGSDSGGRPLLYAAKNNGTELALVSLDSGARVDVAYEHEGDNYDSRTALIVAVQNRHLDLVKALLDREANVNAADRSGFTPLYWAASGHDPEWQNC